MEIKNLKELQKLIKLLRTTGVDSMKLGDLELHLGQIQPKTTKHKEIDYSSDFPEANIPVPLPTIGKYKAPVQVIADKIATDELSEEQLLFYSSGSQEQ